MKRILWNVFFVLCVSVLFNSCTTEDDTDYDEALLYGKWKSGTLYYRYDSNGNGATWDTGDDVSESEAQKFTWTLVKSTLRQLHIIEISGAVIPKTYTVTKLTATTLVYKDDSSVGGVTYTFSKAN